MPDRRASEVHHVTDLAALAVGSAGQRLSAATGAACHTDRVPVLTRAAAVLIATALLGVGLDQMTKALVTATVEGKPPVRLIGRVLTIDVSRNSGAAFSFAPTATLMFSGLAFGIAVLIVTRLSRLRSVGWAVALGLVLAGAVGNLCDRLLRPPGIGRGAVVDFIDLRYFATFNLADSLITCGAALAVVLSLRGVPMTAKPQGHAELL
jgi:signal peptidase II